MSVSQNDLWSLTDGRPQIDPQVLSLAVERQAGRPDLDYRTRLLIRDSLDALERHWGPERFASWLARSPLRGELEQIKRAEFDRPGFQTLHQRLMDATKPETFRQFLRELGERVPRAARIEIGGSGALILAGTLTRRTDDLDVVDEVPEELRSQHDLLDELAARYGLRLTHFQSHYLPSGWQGRLQSLGRFGRLDVLSVDPVDIFVGKLFSARTKDLDDLRVLAPQFDKSKIVDRFCESAGPLRNEKQLADHAARNWYIVFGETPPG